MLLRIFGFLLILAGVGFGQFDPESAHVNLYFPQLADGGTVAQRWQTLFIFQNPHPSLPAAVTLSIVGNDGAALALDFGSGALSSLNFNVPAGGTRTLTTTGAGAATVTGWAVGRASLPVQATVLFRSIENGTPRVDITASPTLPSPLYRSFGTGDLGIAVANPATDTTLNLLVGASDPNGNFAGAATVQVGPRGHASFNLRTLIPALPAGFLGTVEISENNGASFVAWTLNSLNGVLSSLPPGALRWPISHYDRMWLAYWKVLNAAETITTQLLGVDLFNPIVGLDLDASQVINASASSAGRVTVSYALSELISDSASEMGFVLGHEIGHIVQARSARKVFDENVELDADAWAMLFNLEAGFDPYAGAGALAKVAMANGTAGLVDAGLADHFDVQRSLNTRLDNMYRLLKFVCESAAFQQYCADYKGLIHPHFPAAAPLGVPGGSVGVGSAASALRGLGRLRADRVPEVGALPNPLRQE